VKPKVLYYTALRVKWIQGQHELAAEAVAAVIRGSRRIIEHCLRIAREAEGTPRVWTADAKAMQETCAPCFLHSSQPHI
jgi:hypothetical protein